MYVFLSVNLYMTKIKKYIVLLLPLFIFLSAFSIKVFAWSEPTGIAPNNNSAIPLNISNTSQIKNGTLGLNGLLVVGSTSLQDKIQIKGGNPGAGKVLVSDAEGNASWQNYVQARKNADKLRCPAGSSKINLNGRTFCGYWKTLGQETKYCDVFGKSYDAMVACYDKGVGRNHGVTPFAHGCTAWEGERNYGGGGGKMYCEKLVYTPKDPSDCTDPKAIRGILNDTTLSSDPITTCNVQTPYTYKGCTNGFQSFGMCIYYTTPAQFLFGGGQRYGALEDIWATSTTCMAGWTKYLDNCI